ncbi:serine/threonine-protein kinase RCK2 [Entomortierella parvispora]|uniref:Serine/threonine-protein kinase RCK2 n=1 Tax=Entomortierella parvispora TaxID=205924 RepID=A0A9P3LWJ8_9FUNG|nr:serine/threonine-protein kinase RCK2 [Entomortierella parvispora]
MHVTPPNTLPKMDQQQYHNHQYEDSQMDTTQDSLGDHHPHHHQQQHVIPSVQHFTAAAVATPPATPPETRHEQQYHQQQRQQQQQNQQAQQITPGFEYNNNNTEAASRMIAEENEQRNKLPFYPGLERYTLVEKMGDGAFSNVYKARDTKTGGLVAVKIVRKYDINAHQNKHLHKDMKKKPRVTERANILKEVQIMRQLKHPGIVELHEFSESDEHYFLVLELAPGGELFHRIVKLTYFSEELTRHVIVQVAQAIRYLHEEKGVIHRDIKPENILFEPIPIIPSPPGYRPSDEEEKEDEGIFQPGVGGGGIGRVKIADFGLSKVVWDSQTMTPCGTVGYTAPEIVKDERYSKSVDMWAMGCVLYTLLCGFPPFYDESIQALTEKVARGQYTFLSPWWDEISVEVKDLITHLLCVDPVKRYTIDQFLAHPWVRAGEQSMYANDSDALSRAVPEISIASQVPQPQPAFAENRLLANVAAMTPDYGVTPRTPYKRRAENPLSPGVGLREVFDISNAVHRMEEETRRRRAAGDQGDARLRQAFMTQLNEEEEEQDGHMSDGSSGSAMSEEDSMTAQMGNVRLNNIAKAQDRNNLFRQQQEYQRAQEEMAAQKHQAYLRQQQLAGLAIPEHHMVSSASHPINHMSASTSASTVGSTSSANAGNNRRRRAGFELNMNQATLLNRRAKHQVPAPAGHTVEYQEQLMRQQPPAMAV